jgi:predicted Fe-Mo cluster-binding NifX family protein
MKVAVSSSGQSIDSGVDPRFGRCSYFLVVDADTLSHEIVENTGTASAHGAGIGAAQLIASKGVKAVITGHVGPNAYQSLNAAGINIYTVQAGTIKAVVEDLKAGRLTQVSSPTSPGHSGGGGGSQRRDV